MYYHWSEKTTTGLGSNPLTYPCVTKSIFSEHWITTAKGDKLHWLLWKLNKKSLCREWKWPSPPPSIVCNYKFTVVYSESVNLIGYITVFYLLIENSHASVHIAHYVWTWCNIIKQFFSTRYSTFFFFLCNETTVNHTKTIRLLALVFYGRKWTRLCLVSWLFARRKLELVV